MVMESKAENAIFAVLLGCAERWIESTEINLCVLGHFRRISGNLCNVIKSLDDFSGLSYCLLRNNKVVVPTNN